MTRILRRPADCAALAEAALVHAAAKLLVMLVPIQTAAAWLARLANVSRPASAAPETIARVTWAVDAAATRLPFASSCLTRSLTAGALLARRGIPAQLRIGVRRDPAGRFTAHAWLEHDGCPVGSHRPGDYQPLHAIRLA